MFNRRFMLVGIVILGIALISTDSDRYYQIAKNLAIFGKVYQIVNEDHAEGADPAILMRTALDKTLGSLDPYTNFISEAEMEHYRFLDNPGKVGSIGAGVIKFGDKYVIKEIFAESAAQKAGLLPGDIITAIDGEPTEGKNEERIDMMLKGAIGDEIELTYKRDEKDEPKKITLLREQKEPKNVPYYGMVDDKTAYIVLTIFTQEAAKNISEALKDLRAKHKVEQVILDLRDNGGGFLAEAIDIVNIFVPKGREVVSTKSKTPEWDKSFRSLNEPIDTESPLIVLINNHSASASEIVSGALQDFDRAVLVGQKSFGKGLVQNTYDVGYNCKVKLTTAKYYIPSGRCIQAVSYKDGKPVDIADSLKNTFKTKGGRTVYDGGGVLPDYKIEPLVQLPVMKALLEQRFIFAFANDYRHNHDSIPPVAKFSLTDSDFQNFKNFLANKGFKYETDSSKKLAELEEKAKSENYLTAFQDVINSMKGKIEKEKLTELDRSKDLIIRELESEIAARYYYEGGKAEMRLKRDHEVQEALKLFRNKAKYDALVAPR